MAAVASIQQLPRSLIAGECSRRCDVARFVQRPRPRLLASSSSFTASAAPSSSPTWPPDASLLPQGPAAPFLCSLPSPEQIVAVNFYHLVDLPSPRATRKRHENFLRGKDVRGRIYIAPQGINAQFSAPAGVAAEYLSWVKNESEEISKFAEDDDGGVDDVNVVGNAALAARSAAAAASFRDTMRANSEPSPLGEHLFPKLRLKYKPNLISLAGGTASLPITRPEQRAAPLSPREWEAMLSTAADGGGGGDTSKRPIVLDVRNAYEWDAGHFVGAERPLEDNFCETPTGAAAAAASRPRTAGGTAEHEEDDDDDYDDDDDDDDDAASDADERSGFSSSSSSSSNSEAPTLDVPSYLSDVPKDRPVMMYCTGGIRCDIYSAHLRAKGFTNLYTLEGGVHNYFNEVGGKGWSGSLFVFDARMAVAPKKKGEGEGGREGEGEEGEEQATSSSPLPAAAPCLLCGGEGSLPHLNCANIDCNRLFISCRCCAERLRGCCCEGCMSAPRLLRPAKVRGYFGTWQEEVAGGGGRSSPADGAALAAARAAMSAGRGPGRLARRRARAERLSAERAAAKQERLARKAAARAELAKRGGSASGERRTEEGEERNGEGTNDDDERAARLAKLEELKSRLLAR